MLEYTKTAIDKTICDVKIGKFVSDLLIQLLYVGYLIYTLATERGILGINITLLCLTTIYLIFMSAFKNPLSKVSGNKAIKIFTYIYKYTKYVLKIIIITIALLDLTVSSATATPTSILLTAFIIVGFVIQIVVEVASAVIIDRFYLMKEAVLADVENITKPLKAMQKLLKRISGQEIPVEEEPSKKRLILDEIVTEKRLRKRSESSTKQSNILLTKIKSIFKKKAGKTQ